MSDPHMAAGARDLQNGFAAGDARLAAAHIIAKGLRAERAELMQGWSELVATQDFDAITVRSMRLAEIDRELAKTGG
jgi:hypothetical protein